MVWVEMAEKDVGKLIKSKRSRLWAISIKTEQLLLFKEGTHVPEPSIVIFMIYSMLRIPAVSSQ